jgi:rhodanese-related sulfurtransferase
MMGKRTCGLWAIVMASVALTAVAEDSGATLDQSDVPSSKQTELGLYVTAAQAYAKWKQDPDNVKVLDVRTPEEYIFVGHAAMARNIPLAFVQHEWDAERQGPVMTPNAHFVDTVKQHYRPDDEILITCRSGGRSKRAVDILAKAGFTRVYNIIDGMEGDTVVEPGAYEGKRTKNGWKNSEAPWTYDLDPELMYLQKK